MARSDELDANSKKQAKSSGGSARGDINQKKAKKVLSQAGMIAAAGGDGSAIKKSCEIRRKLVSSEISSSGSSPRGDINQKKAKKVLSQADLSAAAGGDGSAIKKSCEFKHKLLSLVISSSESSPRGDLYLEEAEKVLSRAGLSRAAGGSAAIDKRLEKSEARKRGFDLLQKAAIEYCSANLLTNAAQCYEKAAEILNFREIDYDSFTILSRASKCYEKNDQYDKAEQVTLKLINMATEENYVSRIAQFNCELANICVLKQMYGEASKHYEIAYNLYRVKDDYFTDCNEVLEKQANLSILQNDFEAAAKYFVMIVEACHKDKSERFFSCGYIIMACLSFLVHNPKKSSDYFKEKRQNANFSQLYADIVKGIINAVQKKNYNSFKSIIRRKYSYILDQDQTLSDIVFAIEKKYFLVENGSKKKYGKLPADDDDINLENLLEDEKIDRADDNKSKLISKDNSQTAQSSRNSSESSEKEEGEEKEKGDHDNDVDDDIDLR